MEVSTVKRQFLTITNTSHVQPLDAFRVGGVGVAMRGRAYVIRPYKIHWAND